MKKFGLICTPHATYFVVFVELALFNNKPVIRYVGIMLGGFI